ncbi:hypothetical protein I309_02480 [Cryptococcus deuterogattii LA55]|nr:hypothetical protein I309_02480 [Cryptococcus deuterogattii LA55]KIR93574.1 hypothetical protein I304_02247 [Cryptococcus deuterogattii CBS 10090]
MRRPYRDHQPFLNKKRTEADAVTIWPRRLRQFTFFFSAHPRNNTLKMNKPNYPTMQQNGQQMYQASDGQWYPMSAMPQNWHGSQQPPQPGYGGYQQQQGYYGQQQPMYATQPVYVENRGAGAGAGAATGLCAGLCAGLLCLDLCLFC